MTTETATNTVTSNARAAVRILEHAERIGLPMPFVIGANEYDLSFQFEHFSELVDWAAWMEVEIASEWSDKTQHHHHRAESTALGLTVACVTTETVR